MKKQYIREQKYICGDNYLEAAIFPVSTRQHKAPTRSKMRFAQRLAQAKANAKNRLRHLVQLIYTNFVTGDKFVHPTYDDAHLPTSYEQAEKDLDNYLRRMRDRCKFLGLPRPLYIARTEWQDADPENGIKSVRFHHHIVLKCELTRDEIELLWNTGGTGCGARSSVDELRKNATPLGLVNADRLQLDGRGSAEAVAEYITKYQKRKHAWKYSRGLKSPETPPPSDSKYTRAKLAKVVQQRIDDAEYWQAQYPGYYFGEAVATYCDFTGWSMLVKMRRLEPPPKRKRKAEATK